MTLPIGLFLAFGCLFGLATFSNRHLFSEGPHQAQSAESSFARREMALWVSVCIFLWPIMVVSGLNTAWVLARRKARSDRT